MGTMNEIPVKDLEPDTYFSKPVLLDQDYILLSTETPVTRTLINHLIEWGYRKVLTEGVPQQIIPDAESEGDASSENGNPVVAVNAVDSERLEHVRGFYEQFATFVESVYDRYVTKSELVLAEISVRIKALCEVIAENRRFILRVQSLVQPHSNDLVSHSTRSTVLSIVIGSALRLPNHRLIELGTAALLHEIGMVRLPPQLYMASRQLSPQERRSITAHPILGYNVLKEKQVPLAVSLAALEHHERMNGTGYPRGIAGDKISLYSRIIAVACSFDAVTASRPFKEARDGYSGMVDLLKNEGKKYDETVIRALVYSLSIYPIGSYVLLTNGKPAQVVDVNPENPRFPIVQIVGMRTPDGKDLIARTAETGVRILRPLTREEIQDLSKEPASS
jgi:HD-GYP domain-containing protein (c-di-GMP phosphodiesterase class II)